MIQEIAKLSGIPTSAQAELASVISLFTQRPPLTPPANTLLFVASLGSYIIALVLPPTLSGPLSTQLLVSSPGTLANLARSVNSS